MSDHDIPDSTEPEYEEFIQHNPKEFDIYDLADLFKLKQFHFRPNNEVYLGQIEQRHGKLPDNLINDPFILQHYACYEHLASKSSPLFPISVLADNLTAFIEYQKTNRNRLIEIGYPRTSFSICQWLSELAANLLYVKIPLSVQSDSYKLLTVNDQTELYPPGFADFYDWDNLECDVEGNVRFTFPIWPQKPNFNVLSRNGITWNSVGNPCSYEEATFLPFVTPEYAEELTSLRPALFELRIKVFRMLIDAIKSGKIRPITSGIIKEIRDHLGGDVENLLGYDMAYFYLTLHGEEKSVPIDIMSTHSGLFSLMILVQHVEEEILLGTMNRIAYIWDRLGLLKGSNYISAVKCGNKQEIDVSLDMYMNDLTRSDIHRDTFQQDIRDGLGSEFSNSSQQPRIRKMSPRQHLVQNHSAIEGNYILVDTNNQSADISFTDQDYHLPKRAGLPYLIELLKRPNEEIEIDALDLYFDVNKPPSDFNRNDIGSNEEGIDQAAIDNYNDIISQDEKKLSGIKRRMREIDSEYEILEQASDVDEQKVKSLNIEVESLEKRKKKIKEEIEFSKSELSQFSDFHGRPRIKNTDKKRIRDTVTKAIERQLIYIKDNCSSELYSYLDQTIKHETHPLRFVYAPFSDSDNSPISVFEKSPAD